MLILKGANILYLYEHDLPTSDIKKEEYGTVSFLLYHAPSWGDFFKSELFDSIRPLLTKDFSWILINQEGQTK